MSEKLVIPEDLRELYEGTLGSIERGYIERIARAEARCAELEESNKSLIHDCGHQQEVRKKLEAALERMKQPVSDEEWQDFGQPFSGVFAAIQRDGVDRIIVARTAAPERFKDGQ